MIKTITMMLILTTVQECQRQQLDRGECTVREYTQDRTYCLDY